MRPKTLFACLATLFMPFISNAQTPSCGPDGAACATPNGTYHITLPPGPTPAGGWPAMMFFHGAGGSGARTLANTGMVESFLDRGYAVIAPDGLPRPNSRFGPGWSFHPERPRRRDEVAFTRELITDATDRFQINPNQIMLSGFSIGGSLVWYMACAAPDLARAYAPVGGAFWRPHPVASDCDGPVRLLHTHGWRDQTVPLEGRPLRSTSEILQGDVFHGLDLLRQVNGCTNMRADRFQTDADYWRRVWTTCAPDTALEFMLHPGGHSVPAGWATRAMDWFEALP